MATIRDIAKKAGVSVSTASRALNDNPRISQSTKKYIQQIARQFNYHPNYTAQNLSRGEANMVGLVFPVTHATAPANPFHIDLMRGISQALRSYHYQMLVAIAATSKQLLANVESMVMQSKVHHFLLFYTRPHDPVTEYLRQQKLNFVVIGHPLSPMERFVDNDNVAAGRAATNYLLTHYAVHHPVFVASEQQWPFERDREKGFQQVLKDHHLSGEQWPLKVKANALANHLKHDEQVDGLIFADDLLFVRFAQEVRHQHLPVICFNSSRLLSGLLTKNEHRVDLQPRKLGQQAVKLLFDKKHQQRLVDFKIS